VSEVLSTGSLPHLILGSNELPFSTRGDTDVVDLTASVQRVVEESGVGEGQALVFVRGSTAAITDRKSVV
jgi:thiamine phosphate synthase YjbQ (UPF0047 family)